MKWLIFTLLLWLPLQGKAQRMTVSGLSSGGYFAHQFHLAFSSRVSGAGILAGGPYFCARGNLSEALNRCMDTTEGAPRVSESRQEALRRQREGLIDPLENLKTAHVYLLSGTADRTVLPVMGQRLRELYEALGVPNQNMKVVDRLPVGHAFPTSDFGNACEVPSRAPYISNCERDIAGEILVALHGPLKNKRGSSRAELFSFDQSLGINVESFSLSKTAYAYVPEKCQGRAKKCAVHVAFHGCRQTVDDIGLNFVEHTGYNSWANANEIVVLYPQAVRNIMLGNPRGCWDWWGFTGPYYHTKVGPQMRHIEQLLKLWMEGRLALKKVE